MSHDRGCPCGKEPYEYEDCRRADCNRRPMTPERIRLDALDKIRDRKVRGGEPGNCVQCAVATILNLPLESVPNFVKDHGTKWIGELFDWLEPRGYELAVFEGFKPRVGLWLLDGRSPRCGDDLNLNHVVVMQGNLLYHDPDPSNASVQTVRRSYWITPLDPAVCRT